MSVRSIGTAAITEAKPGLWKGFGLGFHDFTRTPRRRRPRAHRTRVTHVKMPGIFDAIVSVTVRRTIPRRWSGCFDPF